MNNLIVYCEIEDGIIADVSLELLTKGRTLANKLNCKLEALVIGHKLISKNRYFLMEQTPYTWLTTKDCILTHPCHTLLFW